MLQTEAPKGRHGLGEGVTPNGQSVDGRLRFCSFLETDTSVKVPIRICDGKLYSFQITSAFPIVKSDFAEFGG